MEYYKIGEKKWLVSGGAEDLTWRDLFITKCSTNVIRRSGTGISKIKRFTSKSLPLFLRESHLLLEQSYWVTLIEFYKVNAALLITASDVIEG